MKNKQSVLLCGATGFIGRNIAQNLSKIKSYRLICTYNNSKPFKLTNCKWIKADLRNSKQVDRITKNVDVVIQAAATTSGAKTIISRPYEHVTDNAIMNSYLLRSSFENKIKHFIFFSCTVMYQSSNKSLRENDFNPRKELYSNYFGVGNTKLYIEKMCEFYSKISSTKFTCIRHSNIFGPLDKFDLNKSHFLGASITKVMKANKEIVVWGDGKEKRDLLYIDDLVNFVKLTIKNQKKKFRIYNCGYGKSFSISTITKKIIKLSQKKITIKYDTTKPTIKTSLSLNCKLASKELGWKRKTSLYKGILKTIQWWKKNFK
tara:strand:- start:42 stop:995 length:954 start_codon:yes stop_codon:yes gene_type:complete